MSCFVVTHNHINAILSYAQKHMLDFHLSGWIYAADKNDRMNQLAQILLDENQKSFNHRYPPHAAESDIITFKCAEKIPTHLEVIKYCNCYEYQSCEHDGWKSSNAHTIISTIRRTATRNLPGYEEIPWGIE